MQTVHLDAGAAGTQHLFLDDEDRYALVRCLGAGLGASVLAYCVMHTHVHVVAEGPRDGRAEELEAAMRDYRRGFKRRHGYPAPPLRGPVEARVVAPAPFELSRTIFYVHENPRKMRVPLVERQVDYPWSSQRAFVGLRRADIANVERARELLGPQVGRAVGATHALAGLGPVAVPTAFPDEILAAAAATFGLPPAELARASRGPVVDEARRVFVRLGELESYTHGQLAPALHRSRGRIWQIAAERVDEPAVRIARTLIRDPRLRRHLPDGATVPSVGAD